MDEEEGSEPLGVDSIYDKLVAAADLGPTLKYFYILCEELDINPKNHKTIFTTLKSKLKTWKYQNLFNRIEKRSKHVDYKNKPCAKTKVLIIGAGPVGLRLAVECAFLGAHVTVIEKRDSFSRNNVLHLWPFLIVDMKSIGVKSFFGKFCAGSLDHISIKRLQCILLKISLFLGVQFHTQTKFEDVIQPSDGKGWRTKFSPASSPLNLQEFDVINGCDGKYNCLKFKRKEFRGKLAIAITCNFKNKQTSEEARVEEISGVAFIYNQEFFHELTKKTGIELENIVYYRDETHYFVMTAKKKSLITTGVIKQDCKDVFKLLSADNVSHKALLRFAKEAADFATNYQLPHHEFAVNHYNKEDVAMFDFTSIHQAMNSSRIYERKGKRLLMCIAGDVLLEPFWPTGSGCARGFLSAFDAAWMIRGFGLNRESLDLLQERESIFQLLPQTKPDTLCRKQDLYSIDPSTRYLNLNARAVKKEQVSHLLDAAESKVDLSEWAEKNTETQHQQQQQKQRADRKQKQKEVDPDTLLKWCKEQTKSYQNVKVVDMSRSWQNGLAFCAIIHRYRPELINYFDLKEDDEKANCEKAFSIAEEHLGIPPKVAARDLVRARNPDTLTIMAYLSLYYEALKQETPVYLTHQYNNNNKSGQTKQQQEPALLIKPYNNQLSEYGIAVAIVAAQPPAEKLSPGKKDTAGLKVEAEVITPSKSPKMERKKTSKMAIISRLSRRSKKNKLTKKTKHDKENKELLKDGGVQLTSYGKSPETIHESGDETTPEKLKNKINVSALVAKTPSPTVKKRDPRRIENNDAVLENVDPTTGQDRYKRISQLAESVFGDKIVQGGDVRNTSGGTSRPRKESSTEGLTESEKCHFCNRKVYVVERQSAEGFFFHRSCFRCNVCKCRLLLGNYAYNCDGDEEEGKFYCKVHYNSLIYKTEESEHPQVKNENTSVKRRRAVTQQVQRSDVCAASRLKTIDDIELYNKHSHTNQVRDIQKKLKANLPQLEISIENKKPYLTKPGSFKIDVVDGNLSDEDDEADEDEEVQSPYDRFTPRSLLDRHPSLLRCSPQAQKVTTTSFMSASKFSVSTPNLTKLIQEDSMFEEERKKHEEKLHTRPKKKLDLGPSLAPQQDKKKLLVPDGLKSGGNRVDDANDKEIYGSDEYRQRYQSYNLSREESFGAVHRRPKEERRAQYPVSMAFTEGIRASGNFQPVSIDIDIDGGTQPEPEPEDKGKGKKKKKLVLKKRKKKATVQTDTINEDDDDDDENAASNLPEVKIPAPSCPSRGKEKAKKEDDWVMVDQEGSKGTPLPKSNSHHEEDFSDSSTSSCEEDDEKNSTLFRRAFGGKKKKKPLTPKEQEMLEAKNKRKQQRKIRKEMKERELKRLWEAQSIQRKLNEVDVKMLEMEERAKLVERNLRSGETSPTETNKLTFEFFNLVNEKNTLLRFESELVIQSNSIQLEDRQARLEQRIRDLLTTESPRKHAHEEVERLTKELVDTVDQRNGLIEMLEDDRLRELEEDKTIEDVFTQKAHAFGMDRLI